MAQFSANNLPTDLLSRPIPMQKGARAYVGGRSVLDNIYGQSSNPSIQAKPPSRFRRSMMGNRGFMNGVIQPRNFSALNQDSRFSGLPRQTLQPPGISFANTYGHNKPVSSVSNQRMIEMANARTPQNNTLAQGNVRQNRTPPNQKNNLLNYILSPQGKGMAQGLLEASGYSAMPVSFGQALAQGMARGNEYEATAAASQLAKDKFNYQKSQDLITNALEKQKIKPQETFEQVMIEVPDGKGGTMQVPANRNLLSGEVKPVMSSSGTNINLGQGTGGWKTVNEKFGIEVNEWVISGGFAGAQANLIKIDDAIEQLEESKGDPFGLTGKNVGIMPKGLRAIFNPDSADLEDNIRSIVYESLRQTLGAQFAEREGEKLIQASFNSMLSEEKNIVRLKRMRAKILEMAKAKQKSYEYFIANNGNMSGYSGSTFVFDNENQMTIGAEDVLNSIYTADAYTDLSDAKFTEYFKNATEDEQAWILQNAENIPQIKIGAEK